MKTPKPQQRQICLSVPVVCGYFSRLHRIVVESGWLYVSNCLEFCQFVVLEIMPPKRNERGKKNRRAKANGSTASSQGSLSTLAKRSPPTRKAKAKAGRAVKRNVAIASNTKPLVSVGKRKSKKVDPIFFTSDDGEQYRVGG